MAPHLPHTFWCERGAVASDKVKRCARLAIARGLHDCGRASHCSQLNTLPPLHSFILYNSLCQSHPDVPFLPLHLSFYSFTSRALSSPAAGSCPFWLGLFLFLSLIFLSIVIAGPRYDDAYRVQTCNKTATGNDPPEPICFFLLPFQTLLAFRSDASIPIPPVLSPQFDI